MGISFAQDGGFVLAPPSPEILSASSPVFVPTAICTRTRSNSESSKIGFGFTWSVYTDCLPSDAKTGAMSQDLFHGQMQCLGGFSTKDVFDKRFQVHLDNLPPSLAMRVFRSGIKPLWEDKQNLGHGSGKWVIQGENQEVMEAAFHAVLRRMSDETMDTACVNGCIFVCKRGQHVLMLWTKAHPRGTPKNAEDPYNVRKLVAELSAEISSPLTAGFKQHGNKGRKGTRSVPSSPMLHGLQPCISPFLSPSMPSSPFKSPARPDSEYAESPGKMSPMLLASHRIMEEPEPLAV